MDADAITSAAQAVHQELVRKLAEQARTQRLRDQLRRPRPGTAPPRRGITPAGGILAAGLLDDSGGLAALSWLLPHASPRSFIPSDPARALGPGRITGPGEPRGLRPPAAPA